MNIDGNTKSLAASQLRALEKLAARKMEADSIISLDRAREMYGIAESMGRMVGLLVDRSDNIERVIVGDKQILYLPDLGRYRFGKGRLRRLRLIYTDLSRSEDVHITEDILTDLEKLRLDLVAAVKCRNNRDLLSYANLRPVAVDASGNFERLSRPVTVFPAQDISRIDIPLKEYLTAIEEELSAEQLRLHSSSSEGAVLVGVYPGSESAARASTSELAELARTAGLEVKDVIIQRRNPDPKTLLGKGKLEEVVLHCLRLGAEMLIFDTELKPFQWRIITNSTELKVLDRSMLILDIFASRALSAEGRLQVELAQLKYLLPRLVEKDAGLSRLSGGIGGRGPGETKLEVGRRRIRDRIAELEKRIAKLGNQRKLRRNRLEESPTPVVAIVGYTNAGKSSLFNALAKTSLLSEKKMFATLDVTRRRLSLPSQIFDQQRFDCVLTDTVGFIRDLPQELRNAFRATLEELESSQLLIHLLDVSEDGYLQRLSSVNTVLEEMGLEELPVLLVCNKCDLLSSESLEELQREFPSAIFISSEQRTGLSELVAAVELQLNTTAVAQVVA
jgi:GTP-binding protein HflX